MARAPPLLGRSLARRKTHQSTMPKATRHLEDSSDEELLSYTPFLSPSPAKRKKEKRGNEAKGKRAEKRQRRPADDGREQQDDDIVMEVGT
jgi:hypothetical protein